MLEIKDISIYMSFSHPLGISKFFGRNKFNLVIWNSLADLGGKNVFPVSNLYHKFLHFPIILKVFFFFFIFSIAIAKINIDAVSEI